MIIAVDLDGTLCSWHEGQYDEAQPFLEKIAQVQALHDAGHRIWIYTGRGSASGSAEQAYQRWGKITEKQLADWNVPHETLIFGKPPFEVLIDDRAISFEEDWLAEVQRRAETGGGPHHDRADG